MKNKSEQLFWCIDDIKSYINDLKNEEERISKSIVGIEKSKIELKISNYGEIYQDAVKLKSIVSNINTLVHFTGILKYLPLILEDDEIIENLCLANKSGIDLITNKRMAEFKFRESDKYSKAYEFSVFQDFIGLAFEKHKTKRKKEVYVKVRNISYLIDKFENSNEKIFKYFHESIQKSLIAKYNKTICEELTYSIIYKDFKKVVEIIDLNDLK